MQPPHAPAFNVPHLHLAPPWAIVWRCLRDPIRLAVSVEHRLVTDRRTDRHTDRQTSRLVFMARLHPQVRMPQFRMPAERRAQFRVPNVLRCAPFRIYKHAQCGLFERTCLQCEYVIPCWQQMGSYAVLRARRSALVLAASTRCLRRAHSIGRGCRVYTCVMAIWADFKMYLLRQFCSNRVEFFSNTQETQTQKMMDQNFDIRILLFLRIFLNFQKGVARSLCSRSGPLWSRQN